MNTDDILRIMDKAKEIGIRSVDVKFADSANLKFSFLSETESFPKAKFVDPEIPTGPVPDKQAEELVKPLSVLDQMTPEEILYYAVPHYDEIQADKEAHKKKLEGKGE